MESGNAGIQQLPFGCHASTSECPRHPIFNHEISHISHLNTLFVRIKPDADIIYAQDKRFADITHEEKSFAVGIINKIAGNIYPVMRMMVESDAVFYDIKITPAFNAFDTAGIPLKISVAFVPADYTEVVSRGHWEAK